MNATVPKKESRSDSLPGVQVSMHHHSVVRTLALLRQAQSLSHADVAQRLGLTEGSVALLERGYDGDARVGQLVNYAAALGYGLRVTLEQLPFEDR